jgi:hypothetical protein
MGAAPADLIAAKSGHLNWDLCTHVRPLLLPPFSSRTIQLWCRHLWLGGASARGTVCDERAVQGTHQKVVFVSHTQNMTTGQRCLHVSAADGAPRPQGIYPVCRDWGM